jgi:hypothetical protein
VAHELAEDEDRRADVERHRRVLERGAVPIPHQVVDEPGGAFRVGVDVGEGLLAFGRDSGGPDHVRVRGGVLDQFDGHVAAERNIGHGRYCARSQRQFHRFAPSEDRPATIMPVAADKASARHRNVQVASSEFAAGWRAG